MTRVLVVDDSGFQRKRIMAMVEACGHSVLAASNGAEALSVLEEEEVDCMLLDLLMPELDGFGVLEALREKGLDLPVIVCSADVQEHAQQRCDELGAASFIQKPPKEDVVRSTLEEVFAAKGDAR